MSVRNTRQGERAENKLEHYISQHNGLGKHFNLRNPYLSSTEGKKMVNVVKTTNQQGLINQASDEIGGGLDHPTLWTAVAIAIGAMVVLCCCCVCCCVCCCGCLAAIYKGATAAWKRAVRGASGAGAHSSHSTDAENQRKLKDKA